MLNGSLKHINTEAKAGERFDCHELMFYVNGKRVVARDIDPRTTLAVFLREHLRLTGTKIGCNEGGCGACTVTISDQDPATGAIRYYSANSCLTPVCAVFGKAVITVEGIGSTKKLHPVQERLALCHGSQCGFCTPGFVMAMYTLLRNHASPTAAEVDEAIQGNLCRCTGYRPILDAFYSFTNDTKTRLSENGNGVCSLGERCCKYTRQPCGGRTQFTTISNLSDCKRYDPTQELIFPPELIVGKYSQKSFAISKDGMAWYQPTGMHELLHLKRRYPKARIVCGNSEVGVELKFRFIDLPVVINPKQVLELREHYLDETRGAFIGSALSLTETRDILQQFSKQVSEDKGMIFNAVIEMLHWFAGKHVRDMASIAGNIATASPISDLNPIWIASGAEVVLESATGGHRTVPIDEHFFTGYRQTIIRTDEVIRGIWIPYGKQDQHFRAYKQAQRRDDDIAIVTGAFSAEIQSGSLTVTNARFAFGGMAATTKLAKRTSEALRGRTWDIRLLEDTMNLLSVEFAMPPGVPGGMERYRQALVQSFFFKFFYFVSGKFEIDGYRLQAVEFSTDHEARERPTSLQLYYGVPDEQSDVDPIGRSLMHLSGQKHVTGQAVYCSDVCPADGLSLVLVLSQIACGTIESVDARKALEVPGVHAFIDHNDVPTEEKIFGDTPVFAKDKITYHGQPIGAIIAEDHETARRAANLVVVKCTPQKPIVTLEEAIEQGSYLLEKPMVVHSGLVEDYGERCSPDFNECHFVVEGSVKMGGQEHFYLETQSAVAIPHEDDQLEVISSTQGCDMVQQALCKVLGLPQHKVVVRVRRVGGGFGGKESASAVFVLPVAIAAMKLRRPIYCNPERFDDMATSGTRHPFLSKYKVGVSKDGKLQNMKLEMFCNSGHTFDLTVGIMHRAIVHCDNVYRWPNADIFGMMCRTNLASNTAFRGFGGPQGMFATETIMKHVAEQCGFDVNELREKNLYDEGDCTPFGNHLHQCNIRRCWKECLEMSDFSSRANEVTNFNRKSKFIKRGIYVTPTKFGVAFGLFHLNQGAALVHVYLDGTVLISVGGMEMGQGLYTKIVQIAARCLNVSVEKVHINETSTDKVPNASPTSASVGSDINGFAVADGCRKILERLKPVIEKNPDGTWEEWVKAAYFARISLSATGFAIIHNEQVNFSTGKGAEMFGYYVYGVACSEVEVDCLTGDHRVIRCDIVMDVGESLNPAIDIGQIEGAFIQGYGLFTMEEIKVRPDGVRLTRGPGTYKIPSADDLPRNFNIKLLSGSSNRMGLFSSKAIGEPPLFLGVSTFFAIREAVRAFRADNSLQDYFRFDSPATPERIRMACEDHIAKSIPPLPEDNSFTPWTVEL